MHTEHLQNVRFRFVVAGWLVAIAITSLVVLALMGFAATDVPEVYANPFWSILAVVLGFFAGGWFAGSRALQAPILHGLGMGLLSLVAWVLLNAIMVVLAEGFTFEGLTPALALALILAQVVAATLGALMGYNMALRGRPGLSEHEPLP